ncbi:polyprenyl synthetase family protein [Jatrophihabitans cynanchi]|uniref:Polyprenyl synthetase family protein n=1 Tax=Jatrophihabitans cynanchi TaxID=2944128 RepID=A0ABY7JY43_9ACTN|nr:polyprenyl synthetase family protein [Jatrophihabitans sp. SB3-54]WAX57349.1 polyprenyl synthetase family protein [Jatrophihabitans sp. SB3-54]
MTDTLSTRSAPMRTPPAIARACELVEPALRAAVAGLADERMRLVASYQLGWCDADGTPVEGGGGKMIRPTLAVLSAQAVGGDPQAGVPGAVALELVHNFSLLHDDIMDRDTERRHRPTGWVAFGEGQAILAGNAMLTAAVEVITAGAPHTLPHLLGAVQHLISGQSEDLALERRPDAALEDVLRMEEGKTAALLACASSIGALAAGAPEPSLRALGEFGRLMGLAFQLVDDVLGVVGDPVVTGKSASSDVRAGKRSAAVVAALGAGLPQSAELAELLRPGPPETEADVTRARELIVAAGGIDWALDEADRLLDCALRSLHQVQPASPAAVADLEEVARFIVARDR